MVTRVKKKTVKRKRSRPATKTETTSKEKDRAAWLIRLTKMGDDWKTAKKYKGGFGPNKDVPDGEYIIQVASGKIICPTDEEKPVGFSFGLIIRAAYNPELTAEVKGEKLSLYHQLNDVIPFGDATNTERFARDVSSMQLSPENFDTLPDVLDQLPDILEKNDILVKAKVSQNADGTRQYINLMEDLITKRDVEALGG